MLDTAQRKDHSGPIEVMSMRAAGMVASALFTLLPLASASASTIDDFVLIGDGNTITFSLPASPAAAPSVGSGGVVAGFYVVGGTTVLINGTPQQDAVEFFSGALLYVGAGLVLQGPGQQVVAVGPLLYSGGSYTPTFDTGSFTLRNFTTGTPYSLTITPESAATPEPGSLLLMSTGLFAVASAARQKRSRANFVTD